jgi:hypothetical protein
VNVKEIAKFTFPVHQRVTSAHILVEEGLFITGMYYSDLMFFEIPSRLLRGEIDENEMLRFSPVKTLTRIHGGEPVTSISCPKNLPFIFTTGHDGHYQQFKLYRREKTPIVTGKAKDANPFLYNDQETIEAAKDKNNNETTTLEVDCISRNSIANVMMTVDKVNFSSFLWLSSPLFFDLRKPLTFLDRLSGIRCYYDWILQNQLCCL